MRRLVTAGARRGRTPGTHGAGFVLLEVLVSMTLMSVGIMAVLTAVLSGLNLQKDAALRHRAGLILQDKLAETSFTIYDGKPIQGITSDGVFSWTVSGVPWPGAPRLLAPSRTGSQTGDGNPETSDGITRQVIEVTVDVSWDSGRGFRHVAASQLVHVPRLVEEK